MFRETAVDGAWAVEVEPVADERGVFARTFEPAAARGARWDEPAFGIDSPVTSGA